MSTLHLKVLAAGALIGASPLSIAQALAQDNAEARLPTGSPGEAPLIPVTPFQGYVLGGYSGEEQVSPEKRDPVVQVLPDQVNVWTKSDVASSFPKSDDALTIESYVDSLTEQEEPVFVFDSDSNLYSFERQDDESLVIYRHLLSSDWGKIIEDQLNPFTDSEGTTTAFSPDWATIYGNREAVNDASINLGQLGQLSVENGVITDAGTVSMGMPFIDFSDHTEVSTGSKDSIVQPTDLMMDQNSLAPLELSTGISRLISQ